MGHVDGPLLQKLRVQNKLVYKTGWSLHPRPSPIAFLEAPTDPKNFDRAHELILQIFEEMKCGMHLDTMLPIIKMRDKKSDLRSNQNKLALRFSDSILECWVRNSLDDFDTDTFVQNMTSATLIEEACAVFNGNYGTIQIRRPE